MYYIEFDAKSQSWEIRVDEGADDPHGIVGTGYRDAHVAKEAVWQFGEECVVIPRTEPEETMIALSEQTGVDYDTLVKAAREGRLVARQSGKTWLSTATAVAYAVQQGRLRPRNTNETARGLEPAAK